MEEGIPIPNLTPVTTVSANDYVILQTAGGTHIIKKSDFQKVIAKLQTDDIPAADLALDLDTYNGFERTITGDVGTLSITGGVTGQTYLFYIKQDATGGRKINALASNISTPGGIPLLLSTAPLTSDLFTIHVRSGGFLIVPSYGG